MNTSKLLVNEIWTQQILAEKGQVMGGEYLEVKNPPVDCDSQDYSEGRVLPR